MSGLGVLFCSICLLFSHLRVKMKSKYFSILFN